MPLVVLVDEESCDLIQEGERMIEGVVPAARDISNFSIAELPSGERVLFDSERLQYHTLNGVAFAVWQYCDGLHSTKDIRSLLENEGVMHSPESVEYCVLELMEAGLIEQDQKTDSTVRINRIAALKIVAATVAGGIVLPAISSITTPVIAETSADCLAFNYPGPPCDNTGMCTDQGCMDFCFNSGTGNCAQCDSVSASPGGCCNCFTSEAGACPCF